VFDKGGLIKRPAFFVAGLQVKMKQSGIERRITKLVQPVIEDKGYALVCVSMQGPDLQIMAENPATRNLGVDECAMLSREIAALLDVEDPIRGRYRLEVSSPGIDRPLVKLQDFADFEGFEVKVEINPPIDGQKRFRGYLHRE
jgi:ribosome maturation factor RimP